jgi:hypothetical protein
VPTKIFYFLCFTIGRIVGALLPIALGIGMVYLQLIFRAVAKCEQGSSNIDLLADGTAYSLLWTAFPSNFWHAVALGALCLSVGSAFVLYYQFPASYRLLQLHPATDAILHFVIPTLQALCIAYASIKIEHTNLHAFATIAYLTLFVIWDGIILCTQPSRTEEAIEFRGRVLEYLITDAFVVCMFVLLFGVAHNQDNVSVFIAGILAVQACMALLFATRIYFTGHLSPRWLEIVSHFNTTVRPTGPHRSAS